jgi:hypothetical protein
MMTAVNEAKYTYVPTHTYMHTYKHAENRMSRKTLDAMMTAVSEAKPLAQKALKLQAKALGKESSMHPADLFAPPPAAAGLEPLQVCVYVCVYIYIYIYIYTYVCVYISSHHRLQLRGLEPLQVYIYIYIYIYTHTHMYV